MAPIITCHAATEIHKAAPKGRVLWIRASWCNCPDVPVSSATMAAAQQIAIPTGTATGQPRPGRRRARRRVDGGHQAAVWLMW